MVLDLIAQSFLKDIETITIIWVAMYVAVYINYYNIPVKFVWYTSSLFFLMIKLVYSDTGGG